jgi:bifunctional polynucleotide phosphatase/kinase
MIPNPTFLECINKINNGTRVLKSLDIIYDKPITFKNYESIVYYEPEINRFDYIAAFDLDWTLTYNEKHLFPKEVDDIKIFPNRRKVLEDILKIGYNIVIFTNQKSRTKDEKERKVSRIMTFIKELKLPVFIYISTQDDNYRKPNIGMWNLFTKGKDIKNIIFAGDALGRLQDFSDSDKVFAENINAREIYSPEDFFGKAPVPVFNNENEIVIFVGMPGSGKSSYYNKYLTDHINIEQDKLVTRQKVLKQLNASLKTGKSIVINATNPSQEDREEFYRKALEHNYKIKVLYFIINGTGFNKLRDKPVPTIVYHKYFKKLDPPTIENTPGELFYIY